MVVPVQGPLIPAAESGILLCFRMHLGMLGLRQTPPLFSLDEKRVGTCLIYWR